MVASFISLLRKALYKLLIAFWAALALSPAYSIS
nr:MAG TPA: hypothetical protein [Caudoviricetes sp.]